MTGEAAKTWLRQRLEHGFQTGFQHAYDALRVDPSAFLMQLRAGYGVPVSTFQGVYSVELSLLDHVGHDIVRAGMKVAAVEGAGMGLGGMFTLIPDLSILAAITMRTLQKLSLTYGFEYNTDQEIAELWIAAASAAGVDLGRELLEKQVVNRFVPKVIQRVAVKASSEVVEKWSGRMIPVASSVIGATLNYYFIRSWGDRAQNHFRRRHLGLRESQMSHIALQGSATLIS